MRTKLEVRDSDNSVLGVLDIGKDSNFPFTLTKKIASLSNISKRGGSYSKTFKIPATKANNQLLHNLYSSNQRNVKDMKNRKSANVLVDNKIIERGYLKVTNVEDNKGVRSYVCKYFGDNSDWMTALSETTLKDLTYGAGSVGTLDYTRANVIDSWNKTYTGTYDHVFAWINYGQYEVGNGLATEDFRPSLRYKAIIERALNNVGYKLSSTFMGTSDFEQLIMPYIGDGFQHSQANVDAKLFRASSNKSNTDTYYADAEITFSGGNVVYSGGLVQTLRFNDDSTGSNFDTGGNYNTTSYRYTIPTPVGTGNGKYRFAINAKLDSLDSSVVNAKVSWQIWKNGQLLETFINNDDLSNYTSGKTIETGYYKLLASNPNHPITPNDPDFIEFKAKIFGAPAILKVYEPSNLLAVGNRLQGQTTSPYLNARAEIYKIITDNNNSNLRYLFLKAPEDNNSTNGEFLFQTGETVTETAPTSPYAPTGVTAIVQPFTQPYNRINWDNANTYVKLIDMSKQLVEFNQYTLADILPEVKVLDLFADITKVFNLYWRTDTRTKIVYVEERDSFFKSYTTALNWTDKFAINKPYKLNFLENYNRDLIFKYAEDSNDKYLEKRNQTFQYQNNLYCSYKHELPTRFPKGDSFVKTSEIAPTYIIHDPKAVIDNTLTRYGVTARMWNEPNLNNSAPPQNYGFNPRILNYQYGAQTDIDGNALSIDFYSTNYTNIPSALPIKVWNNTVPYSLSFAQSDGLVLSYYGRTLGVIEDSLQLEAYIHLTDSDYQNLDMSKPIYLNNPEEVQGYWLIDTISDYSPFKDLTKVTLTKYHKNDSSGRKVIINTDSSPNPFPNPTGGDFPPNPTNVFGHGTGADGTETDGDDIRRMGIVAQNGTNNRAAKGSASFALGQGCVAKYKNQSMLGSYPEISDDMFAIGVGNENERITGLRADSDGNVTIYGGEIYTINDNGERVPVYTESDNKTRKIYLK